MRFGLVHQVMTNALAALGVLALVSSGELSRWVNVAILAGLAAALALPETWHERPWLRRASTFSSVAFLCLQVARLLFGRPMLELAVEFAAFLQLVRLATRRGAAHDQQVIILSLLHFIAGTVLGGGLAYGLCFLGFLVVAPGALVLSHLRREVEGNYRQGARDRTGLPVDVPRILRSRRVVGRTFLGVTCLLAVPILAFTGLVFLLFPRVGLSLLLLNRPHGGRMVGFSDRVDLGGVGTLRDDPTIALRVEIPDLPEPPPERVTMYLRGTAFDTYDGRAWSRTINTRSQAVRDGHIVPIERYPDPGRDRLMRIDLEPIDPTVLFVPLNAVALDIRPRGEVPIVGPRFLHVTRGPEGEFRYGSVEERGVRYDVYLARQPLVSNQSLGKDERSRYLTLPAGVSPRVVALAEEWTTGLTTPLDRARAIEDRLRTGYRYDLGSPSSGAPSPLDHFLFESKRGHCEFYSTAMAMLLRVSGVPSRNVTGFVGGTYNRFGRYYAVRQGDAHSWVEAYVDGFGWVTFDPTPPVDVTPRSDIHGLLALLRDILEASGQRWNRHIVGYDLHQQLSLFERVRSWARASTIVPAALRPRLPWAVWIGAGASLGVAFVIGRRYLPKRPRVPRGSPQERERATGVAISLYETLDAAMASLGVPRPQGTPPLRYAESLALRRHPCADEILELTKLYLEVRFGGSPFDEADLRTFERRVRALGGRAKTAAAAQRAQEQREAEAQAQPASAPRPKRRPPPN
ncbi:MAG: transglutaminaseTgpA domain-containing protein [Polyangiaceae bacterium]|jgi:hypothetical protein|nr:transglutaminaseTgpA domain-containing protein [Polyangiaceae bacterium]